MSITTDQLIKQRNEQIAQLEKEIKGLKEDSAIGLKICTMWIEKFYKHQGRIKNLRNALKPFARLYEAKMKEGLKNSELYFETGELRRTADALAEDDVLRKSKGADALCAVFKAATAVREAFDEEGNGMFISAEHQIAQEELIKALDALKEKNGAR